MINAIGSRRIVGVGALALTAAAVIAWLPAGAQSRAARRDEALELAERILYDQLKGSVDVYFGDAQVKEGQPSLAGVRVKRIVGYAGVLFIRAEKNEREHWLINPARVAAFRVRRKE